MIGTPATEPVRLSRTQVREIDRRAIEQYYIPGIVLMENAGACVAGAARSMLGPFGRALILCGGGNNGGDGLVAARHLHNQGVEVELLLTSDPAKYVGDALINWNIVRTMALACGPVEPGLICRQALIIDAIFGTGLDRPPREPFPALAEAINQSGNPVLAVDLPSGLDCDTGQPLGVCVKATRTVTFVAQKLGFANVESRPFTGRVIVGDIGCPRELIEQVLCDLPAT